MRSEKEIRLKMEEIQERVCTERTLEIATRAACENDALQWALGYNVVLHDMAREAQG